MKAGRVVSLSMVVTDLDGTLAQTGGKFSSVDLETLRKLGEEGVVRVIATGRNLYSSRRILPLDFPIDYLIFSSGVGILNWKTQEILHEQHLEAASVSEIVKELKALEADFMIHSRIPDNHHFVYEKKAAANSDFETRCKYYEGFCKTLTGALGEASQFLCIDPPAEESAHRTRYSTIKNRLSNYSVIRATSPFDGKSLWTEIFHKEVGKEKATKRLAQWCAIEQKNILAVGNDFNDVDLLHWAGTGYLVNNATLELSIPRVASNNENGFTEAVKRWRGRV